MDIYCYLYYHMMKDPLNWTVDLHYYYYYFDLIPVGYYYHILEEEYNLNLAGVVEHFDVLELDCAKTVA